MNWNKVAVAGTSVAIGITAGVFIGIKLSGRETKDFIVIEKPIIRTKTEVRTDTVTLSQIVTSPCHVKEKIVRTDTISTDTVMRLTSREYVSDINTDSVRGMIRAVVSGYNPSLDTLAYSLTLYPKTATVTTIVETPVLSRKKKKIGFGLFAGPSYNFFAKSLDLSVGVGIVFMPF